jgi:antitoxin CptB
MTASEAISPDQPPTPREIRLKQLRFRAWRRGFREHDFLMGSFADRHLSALPDDQLDAFQGLLDEPDWDVYAWILGSAPVPDAHQSQVMDLLRSHHHFAHTLWSPQGQQGGNPPAGG